MIGNLNNQQIEDLLHQEVLGRIGVYGNGKVYIVPISYAYQGDYIYCHTREGMKLDIMRKNPEVCFEVEDLKDMRNWQSVICWGSFEEIKDKQKRQKAIQLLLKRPLTVLSSVTTHLGASWPFADEEDIDEIDGIVFRIHVQNATGKFEQPDIKHARGRN
jgi:uncharacterized protein